ncbi:MAG: hypothetical protein NUW01_04965 [Gemmatimonadaceae bacterium]|nr:hypothetical protein [Gemmatimonadaceae bacterium]
MAKATKNEARIFIAKETFSTVVDGSPVVVAAGVTRVREGHSLLRGREHMFEVMRVDYEVEQMTNAPGEHRGDRS